MSSIELIESRQHTIRTMDEALVFLSEMAACLDREADEAKGKERSYLQGWHAGVQQAALVLRQITTAQ